MAGMIPSAIGLAQNPTTAQKIENLGQVKSSFSNYTNVRDANFFGKTGVEGLSQQWNELAIQWLNSWDELVVFAQASSSIPAVQLDGIVRQKLDAIADIKTEIDALSITIASKAETSITKLKANQFPAVLDPVYAAKIEAAVRAQEELIQAFIKSASVIEEKVNRLSQLTEPARDIILAKLKSESAKSASAPLSHALARVISYFEFEKFGNSMVQDLNKKQKLFRKYYDKSMVFAAELNFLELDKSCASATASMAASIFDNDFKVEGMKRIFAICQDSKTRWEDLTKSFSHAQILADGIKITSRDYTARCNAGDATVNCVKFSWLGRLERAQILKMTEAELRNLEENWLSLENID